MSCSAGKTHKLEILVYPDHDDVRQWRNLSTGLIETDAAVIALLEAEVLGEDCETFCSIGQLLCYGASGGANSAEYEIGADNESDGVFSIGGTGITLMKWEVDSPASASDGLAAVTLAAQACIDAGGTASFTLRDQDGVGYTFDATGYTAGNADGSGGWLWSGPGAAASGSGKTAFASVTCSVGGGSGGKAYGQYDCETGTAIWRDHITSEILTTEQVATLEPCVPQTDECPEFDNLELIRCAAEATTTINGTPVNVGDQILTITQVDCNNIAQGSTSYHVSSGEEVEGPITEQCDPEPDIETIRECIVDTKGNQWTQVNIIDPADPTNPTVIYYDDDNQLGTPEGDPSEWGTCSGECFDVEIICYCVQSKGSVKTVKSKEVSKSKVKEQDAKPGKILEVCEARRYLCDGEYAYSTYIYQGREFDQATWDKLGLTQVSCDTPDVTYSPAAVTCASEVVDGVTVVVNCQVFTNDSDPTDSFTQYTLADNYTGIGEIGDVYTPADELNVIPCPDGSITETEECYEALFSIKGVANAGDTITVLSVTNAVAVTTFYTITHSTSGSIIYEGTDPVGDAGIDVTDAATWNGPVPCQPEAPDNAGAIPIAHEAVCANVDGVAQYIQPVSQWLNGEYISVGYLDKMGRPITGEVTDADPCDCPCLDCSDPTACILFDGFDTDRGLVTPGDTMAFDIQIDGVSQSVIVHDYTTTSDGVNVSTYYDPIIAAVNALPGWSMTLVADVAQTDQGKPTWMVEYTGSTPRTLTILKADSVGSLGSSDGVQFGALGDGTFDARVIDGGTPLPDYNSPVLSAC